MTRPVVCLSALAASLCLAFGGSSVSDSKDGRDGRGGASGSGGSGGDPRNPFCPGAAPAPEITLTPKCSNFVPSLSTATIDWVGTEAVDGKPGFVGHRFDAPEGLANGCGYEIVVALPGLTFAGSGTYNLNAWWLQGNGPVRLIAAVLRRDGEPLPELGVAVAEAGSFASSLSAPVSIEPTGPECESCWTDGAAAGLRAPAFSEGVTTSCSESPGVPTLFNCLGSAHEWNVVVYCAAEGTPDYPVVYGRAERLTR